MAKKTKPYHPSQEVLKKYADVLVNFALGNGKGIKKGDAVLVIIADNAKPLLVELRKAITKAGGHIILKYFPGDEDRYNFSRDFYDLAQSHQLCYAPLKYFEGVVEDAGHALTILSADPKGLEGVAPEKVSTHTNVLTKLRKYYVEKEQAGKFSWTIALYGTPELAAEAELSPRQYWNQIINACFLSTPNPIQKWRKVTREMDSYQNKLTKLGIEKVHIEGPEANLHIAIGKHRRWLCGGGNNIPSFEIFTSPDWRGTNGWIQFNQPLYYGGSKIEDISLEFKKGKVVKATAKRNERLLQKMIATKNADKVGEFSLTDKRHSRITKFMAETLYDENIGGRNGNTHIALGSAYTDTCTKKSTRQKDWAALGFNESSVHTDIISTTPRTVTATLANGSERVIYKNGSFTL